MVITHIQTDHQHSLRDSIIQEQDVRLNWDVAFYKIESGRTDEIQFSQVRRRENSEQQKNLTLKQNFVQIRKPRYPFHPLPPRSPVIELVKQPPTGGKSSCLASLPQKSMNQCGFVLNELQKMNFFACYEVTVTS